MTAMDPASIRAQILSIARQLVDGQLGVIRASRQLDALSCDAEPCLRDVLLTFVGIASESDPLPAGEVRQYWRLDALERKDREIVEFEQFYREAAVKAATEVIRLIETPSGYSNS